MTHGREFESERFELGALARVEGEGRLVARMRDGSVETVELSIFEPPRYFEAMLVGRRFEEAPDMTARICGICPVAYELSACRAMEDCCGVELDEELVALRRLLYCGEWIQSHALHVNLLHAPDFLGLPDAIALAALDRSAVERGLELKRVGNLVMSVVGGRAVHPVNVRVGGFYHLPSSESLGSLVEPLTRALGLANEMVEWVSAFAFPELERDWLFVALHDPARYAISAGSEIRTSTGESMSPAEFDGVVVEEHVERSNALLARLGGTREYLTGPLARYALNYGQLRPGARAAAEAAGLGEVVRNPFRSIVVRAVEVVQAIEEALEVLRSYRAPLAASVTVEPRAGSGFGATEAPRGLLLHRYELDHSGIITRARILPPTSQNQLAIEADLRALLNSPHGLGHEALVGALEQAVRNHDPCISCAAHFLDVEIDAGGPT